MPVFLRRRLWVQGSMAVLVSLNYDRNLYNIIKMNIEILAICLVEQLEQRQSQTRNIMHGQVATFS